MTQTKLLGFTLSEAIAVAEKCNACESQLARLQRFGSWEAVLQSDRLPGFVFWWLNETRPQRTPEGMGCACARCEAARFAQSPELVRSREILQPLYEAYSASYADSLSRLDALYVLAAALREHLTYE